MSKLWGGRFEVGTDREVEAYTASIGVDARLWDADIRGSIAHVRMLGDTGILPKEDTLKIIGGLEAVHKRIASGSVEFNPNAEDVHSEIELLLGEEIGALAGKLHTARSRNDQVATDTRLYFKDAVKKIDTNLVELQNWIVATSEKHLETILPGLTHMQHAQPVSLAHHLMAYFWMFQRDRERLADCVQRADVLPLGSAALAGTSFPLNRKQVAKDLGFARVSENSLDAVSDRDFIVEFLSAGATIMMHLSRLADENVLWSMPEIGFVELSDAVTTGSSIMPQKKNPDVAELIRGRVGRLNGALIGMLTTLKALPLSYNRDLQEDKVHLFEGIDTVTSSVRLMYVMVKDAKYRTERMAASLKADFSNATDLADELVRKGLPFRQAHEVTGLMVRHCIESKKGLEDMTLAEMQKFSPLFDANALEVVKHVAVMRARTSEGGTGPGPVAQQIALAKSRLGRA